MYYNQSSLTSFTILQQGYNVKEKIELHIHWKQSEIHPSANPR